ncbi:caveolin-1-like [Crassostrea virginica]|uniref:Caveolin n=1 Tax=Crassostrea virginica TaxID=6565 RepID=A0A8B8E4T4_CRAVI|nr:caveolin-1-like [Crassostrea virginica]
MSVGNTDRVEKMADFDMVNRDPNSLNNHLKVQFEDILAEPEGVRSLDCVWKLSYKCFSCWKTLCYVIMTTLCGICLAAEWGCQFSYIAFVHIWYITPCFKILELNCGCLQKLYGLCIHCCLDPMCEACGLIFHKFQRN